MGAWLAPCRPRRQTPWRLHRHIDVLGAVADVRGQSGGECESADQAVRLHRPRQQRRFGDLKSAEQRVGSSAGDGRHMRRRVAASSASVSRVTSVTASPVCPDGRIERRNAVGDHDVAGQFRINQLGVLDIRQEIVRLVEQDLVGQPGPASAAR